MSNNLTISSRNNSNDNDIIPANFPPPPISRLNAIDHHDNYENDFIPPPWAPPNITREEFNRNLP